jgi:hypothetical protein
MSVFSDNNPLGRVRARSAEREPVVFSSGGRSFSRLIRGAPDDREAKMREFAPSLRRRRSAQKFFSVESARVTFVEKLIQAMIMHMNRGWKWDVLSMGPPRWVVR